MRLIAELPSEEQAFRFSEFLSRNKIQSQYEPSVDSTTFDLWIYEESDVMRAFDYYQQFILHPNDLRFNPQAKKEELRKTPFFFLTYIILAVCSLCFIWNTAEEYLTQRSTYTLTKAQQLLFFDNPKAMQETSKFIQEHSLTSLEQINEKPAKVQKAFQNVMNIPFWKGLFPLALEKVQKEESIKAPLFERIQEGEVWRLISPIFMHQDLLHIFFNMSWLLILGRPIEARIARSRMLLLIILLAVFSNTAQYMMSGPYFLGFSGVVTGLAGFVWSRQTKAPREGYPFHRTTLVFLCYFVLILFFISVVSFILKALGWSDFTSSMANTAHISGGLLGLILGRSSFFASKVAIQ